MSNSRLDLTKIHCNQTKSALYSFSLHVGSVKQLELFYALTTRNIWCVSDVISVQVLNSVTYMGVFNVLVWVWGFDFSAFLCTLGFIRLNFIIIDAGMILIQTSFFKTSSL